MFPNEAEATAIAGIDDVEAAAVAMARLGADSRGGGPLVVVKRGRDGALVASTHGVLERVGAYPVDAVDTTGAGDAFDAGFLAAWLEASSDADALRMAAISGAMSTRAARRHRVPGDASRDRHGHGRLAAVSEATRIGRLVGVSLNPAIDKIAAVEAVQPGRIHRPEMLAAVPGGKALNAVRAARHLGLPADVVAVVGGHAGAWLAAELDARGIHHWLVWVEGETRTCLSVLDRQTGDLTEFYEAGIALSEDRWPSVETALGEALDEDADATVVLLAGIVAAGRAARCLPAPRPGRP